MRYPRGDENIRCVCGWKGIGNYNDPCPRCGTRERDSGDVDVNAFRRATPVTRETIEAQHTRIRELEAALGEALKFADDLGLVLDGTGLRKRQQRAAELRKLLTPFPP